MQSNTTHFPYQEEYENACPDSARPLISRPPEEGYSLTPINVQTANDSYRHSFLGIKLNFSALRAKTFSVTPKSFIFVISVVQMVIFAITSTLEPSETIQDFPCVLYKFGAKYTPAILTFHHVHRLILPVLLHLNYAHIIGNLSLQLLVGFRLEKVIGTKHMIIFYCLCGIGGNLLSAITGVLTPSLGASSAIMGLLGLCCAYIVKYWNHLETDNIDRFIALFAIVNVFYTFFNASPGVDNSAHLGGFVVGLFLGVLYMQKSNETNKIEFNWKAILSIVLLVAFFVSTLVILLGIPDHHQEAYQTAKMCRERFDW